MVLGLVCCVVGVVSCRSSAERGGAAAPRANPALLAPARADSPTGTDTTSAYAFPLVDVARGGLEVQWWVADDSGGEVGAALFDLADGAAPIPASTARAWIENGLRVVRVKLEDLGTLQARLPAVRSLERTWYGGVLDYKPLFVGRRVGEAGGASAGSKGPVLQVDGRPERLQPGVLRLIGRAWSAASESGDVLRFEAAVQLQTSSRDEAMAALNLKGAGPRTVVEEGRVFSSLTMETALPLGFVYVIAPESPGVEWRGAEPRPGRVAEGEGANAAGPVVRPLRTVGEAMMSFDPGDAGEGGGAAALAKRRLKALVVVIPR